MVCVLKMLLGKYLDRLQGGAECEMEVDPGTIVLGMILDTLSGRSPLYRLEEFFAHQDTALLLGQDLAPDTFNDDTVGRVLERLYDVGTMKIFTACAVRADQVYG